jgi:CheY-like chemotaxis protein
MPKNMKKTILVIEDEKLSRKLISGTLTNHGFECLTAENGQYALNTLENNHCDLILTDLRMPIMNGIDFISAFRAKEAENNSKMLVNNQKKIPIVVLSAEEGEMLEYALKLDIEGYFIKSLSIEALVPKLKNLLRIQ